MQNAWVLTFLTVSRFAYLVMLFPIILKLGRRLFHQYESRKGDSVSSNGEERTPLLAMRKEENAKVPGEEANHFDVCFTLPCTISAYRCHVLGITRFLVGHHRRNLAGSGFLVYHLSACLRVYVYPKCARLCKTLIETAL